MLGKFFGGTDAKSVAAGQPDTKFFGDGDTFKLICKASSQEGKWMKSTKAMYIAGAGVVVQTTTQQGDNVVDTSVFVPNTVIVKRVGEISGEVLGRRIVADFSAEAFLNARENWYLDLDDIDKAQYMEANGFIENLDDNEEDNDTDDEYEKLRNFPIPSAIHDSDADHFKRIIKMLSITGVKFSFK